MMNTFHKAIRKKILACLLPTVIFLSTFSACYPITLVSFAEKTSLTQGAESTPTPEAMPYTGDSKTYTYRSADPRDREWEEDIVFFANTFLDRYTGHPKLVDRGCSLYYVTELRDGYADYDVRYESLFDPALRAAFIDRVNELLLSIGEKNDDELFFGVAEVAALLQDAHTTPSDTLMIWELFPLWLVPIYTPDGTPQAYICGAPKGQEDLLLCRLDAINDVSISMILEKAGEFIPHESMTWVQSLLLDDAYFPYSPLLNVRILRYMGVIGEEEDRARFSLTDESGEEREVELPWTKARNMPEMVKYLSDAQAPESMSFDLLYADADNAVWHRFLDGGKILYIRLKQCSNDMDQKVKEAVVAAEKAGGVEKLILDFRNNGGGNNSSNVDIVRSVNSLDAPGGKYVLIDGGSFSAAVLHPAFLRRFCEGVTLVGAPAGQPPNRVFCRGGYYSSPHKHIAFHVASRDCYYGWPENNDPALMPDVLVYQTLDDYKNGVDSVLKYVLSDAPDP